MRRLNAVTLALAALRHQRLPTALNLLLMALGVALMTFILSASAQLAAMPGAAMLRLPARGGLPCAA